MRCLEHHLDENGLRFNSFKTQVMLMRRPALPARAQPCKVYLTCRNIVISPVPTEKYLCILIDDFFYLGYASNAYVHCWKIIPYTQAGNGQPPCNEKFISFR